MDKRTKGCLLIGLGVTLLLVVVAGVLIVGGGYWFVRQLNVQTDTQSPDEAAREMDAARARFANQEPFIVLDGDRPGVRPDVEPPPAGSAKSIESLHLMAFDANDGQLVRLTIPFWVLRLAPEGKLSSGSDALRGVKGADRLTVEQLESLGPGLLIDDREPDGSRVLLWTE